MGIVSLKSKLKKQTLKPSVNKQTNGKRNQKIRDYKAITCRYLAIGARDYRQGSYSIFHNGDVVAILIRPKHWKDQKGDRHRTDYHSFVVGVRENGNFKADPVFLTEILPLLAKYANSDRQTILNQLKSHCRKWGN